MLAFLGHAGVAVVIVATLLIGLASASRRRRRWRSSRRSSPRDRTPGRLAELDDLQHRARGRARARGARGPDARASRPRSPSTRCSYLVLAAALLVVRPRRRERPARRACARASRSCGGSRGSRVLLLVVATRRVRVRPGQHARARVRARVRPQDVVGGYIVGAFGVGAVSAAFVRRGQAMARRRLMALRSPDSVAGIVLFALVALARPGVRLPGRAPASATSRRTRPRPHGCSSTVDESQRGRIMALWSIAFLGLRPFASLIDGAIASAAGVRVGGGRADEPALATAGLLLWRERRGVEVPHLQA